MVQVQKDPDIASGQLIHTPQAELPRQIQAVRRAASFMPAEPADMQAERACEILTKLCHPEADQRMTAEDLVNLSWLEELAAVPLSACPVAL